MSVTQIVEMARGPSLWRPDHVAAVAVREDMVPPVIGAGDVVPVLPGMDVWDMWPLARRDGMTVDIAGATLWFALSAPRFPDPIERHGHARIRLLILRDGTWHDGGPVFQDGFAPGSRDWSGSAILDEDSGLVTLFFTAAGRAGEARPTVEQRLFKTSGMLDRSGAYPCIVQWSAPYEFVVSDDRIYTLVNQAEGAPGELKAFRDPGYFRDPSDGNEYVLFAASYKPSSHKNNGMIGIARSEDRSMMRWTLLDPLITADGVCNELERPHAVSYRGQYYVFWSTQATVFEQGGPVGPTGLYGMVAPSLFGPYRPINGSGLVLANPPSEPTQAYSWWVMGDLSVTSFVDYWGLRGRMPATNPELARSQFGGVPAPFLQLRLDGDRAWLEG